MMMMMMMNTYIPACTYSHSLIIHSHCVPILIARIQKIMKKYYSKSNQREVFSLS